MAFRIEEILRLGKEMGASDVHLTVGLPPKMRINGKLFTAEGEKLLPQDTLELATYIMNERQRTHFDQFGECDMSYAILGEGRYRVNLFKQRGSVAMAIRLVDTEIPTPQALGMPQSVVELYRKQRGLILVTGPTGSGKSTTLASFIDTINSNREAHVITLEDPIEYLHKHKKSIVNQREIGLDSINYANALKAALREDPDVILVGEMRDYETISVAVTAAETGHLVLSTLHTLGAANTVDRIIDVFPAHQQQQIRIQFANVLEAVVSQQLVPTADHMGRVAAFEVLHATPAVRNLIREGKTHQLATVMQTNGKLGMMTMDDCLVNLYKNRKISEDMVYQFAMDQEAVKNKIAFM